MEPKPEIVRRRFILSSAMGLAMAIIVGYPITGWLTETHGAHDRASLSAFHLAKAGVDRGLWQINQQRSQFDSLMRGRPVAGLDGDVAFSDVPGGTYRVKARYDRGIRAIRVLGEGTDAETGASRSIELVLRQAPDRNGLMQIEWREVPAQG